MGSTWDGAGGSVDEKREVRFAPQFQTFAAISLHLESGHNGISRHGGLRFNGGHGCGCEALFLLLNGGERRRRKGTSAEGGSDRADQDVVIVDAIAERARRQFRTADPAQPVVLIGERIADNVDDLAFLLHPPPASRSSMRTSFEVREISTLPTQRTPLAAPVSTSTVTNMAPIAEPCDFGRLERRRRTAKLIDFEGSKRGTDDRDLVGLSERGHPCF